MFCFAPKKLDCPVGDCEIDNNNDRSSGPCFSSSKRRSKGRQKRMEKYDAAIIGGGRGWPGSGASSCCGYKSIILEKQSILGGRYTAADYKGYRVTTVAYYIVHPNGPVIQLSEDMGVQSQLDIAPPPVPYLKYRIDGRIFRFPKKGNSRSSPPGS